MRSIAVLALLASCTPAPDASFVQNHNPSSSEVAGLDRLGTGAFVPGRVERFRVVHNVPGEVTVAWEASDGSITGDGSEASWTVPERRQATVGVTVSAAGKVAHADLDIGITIPEGLDRATAGIVDPSPDNTGEECDIAFVGANPVILYRNITHPSAWLATWTGSAWQRELVDGMGFEVGGQVGGNLALVLGSTGAPHVVYSINDVEVWYATKPGATWIRERVATDYNSSYHLGIALDPSNGERPTVVYTNTAYPTRVVFAWRTGVNTWARDAAAFPIGTTSQTTHAGPVFNSAGKAFIAFWFYGDYYAGTFQAAARASALMSGNSSSAGGAAALDSAGRLLVLDSTGVYRMDAAMTSSLLSPIEYSSITRYDLAWGGNKPHVVLAHTGLEYVTTDAASYWTWVNLGSFDSAMVKPGIALDSSGVAHFCYQSQGKIQYQ